MARYPKVLEYLRHIASLSDRLGYEEIEKTKILFNAIVQGSAEALSAPAIAGLERRK